MNSPGDRSRAEQTVGKGRAGLGAAEREVATVPAMRGTADAPVVAAPVVAAAVTPSAPMAGATLPAGSHRWVHGPIADIALMLAWVPFCVAAAVAMNRPHALGIVVAMTLLISLAHQPLTLALIYGDPAQFAVARRVFTVAPFVLVIAIVVGRHISIALVGAVAGLWNAEHTLMQRYGVVRIYGRKNGESHRTDERPLLVSWLVLALVFAAADHRTIGLLRRIELGETNTAGVKVLHSLQPWARVALVPVALLVVVASIRWWRAEAAVSISSPSIPKRLYLASTAVLFAVMLWNPIAGLVGYVGAHALEYVVIVHSALGRRYLGPAAERGGAVGVAVRSRCGPIGCVAVYLVAVVVLLRLVQRTLSIDAGAVVLLTVGGMHVLFDGFIWKLRRPVVARSLAADGRTVTPSI